MKTAEPLEAWDFRLQFVRKNQTWQDTSWRLARYMARLGLRLRPLLILIRAASDHPSAKRLFSGMSLHNLVVSDTGDFKSINGYLHIAFDPIAGHFIFHHIALDGTQEIKTCPPPQALGVYLEFIQRKFPGE